MSEEFDSGIADPWYADYVYTTGESYSDFSADSGYFDRIWLKNTWIRYANFFDANPSVLGIDIEDSPEFVLCTGHIEDEPEDHYQHDWSADGWRFLSTRINGGGDFWLIFMEKHGGGKMEVKLGNAYDSAFHPDWTSLHTAAALNRTEKIAELIKSGANISARDGQGKTPLHCAAEHGHPRAVKALIDAGADLNSTDNLNNSCLRTAVIYGDEDLCAMLIKAGADVNRNVHGATPLHSAAQINNTNIVRMLIEAGADFDIKDEEGNTPDDLAESFASHDAAAMIRSIRDSESIIADVIEGATSSTDHMLTQARRRIASL